MNLPKDANYSTIQLSPSVIALARTVNASIGSSSAITFNAATTFIRVYANVADVYFKWGAATCSSSTFDEIIPAGQLVDFVVPAVASTGVLYTGCTFIQAESGATITVIEK